MTHDQLNSLVNGIAEKLGCHRGLILQKIDVLQKDLDHTVDTLEQLKEILRGHKETL